MFNATFNIISNISWLSVLLVEETRVSVENHWPAAKNSKKMTKMLIVNNWHLLVAISHYDLGSMFSWSQKRLNYLVFQSFDLDLPDKNYSRNVSCTLKRDLITYLLFYLTRQQMVSITIDFRMHRTSRTTMWLINYANFVF